MKNEQISKQYENELKEYAENCRTVIIASAAAHSSNPTMPKEPKKPIYYFFDAKKYKENI